MAYGLLVVVMVVITFFFKRAARDLWLRRRRAGLRARAASDAPSRCARSSRSSRDADLLLPDLLGALDQSLRNPIDTFTVAGFGIPWVNFQPTLNNWIDQLSTPETVRALTQQHLHRRRRRAAGAGPRHAGRLRARPLPLPALRTTRHHGLVPVAARAAAGRDRDPVLSHHARARPARHRTGAHPAQRHLRAALRRGHRPPDLPRPAGRARGGGARRRRRPSGAPSCASRCRSPPRRSPPPA